MEQNGRRWKEITEQTTGTTLLLSGTVATMAKKCVHAPYSGSQVTGYPHQQWEKCRPRPHLEKEFPVLCS